MSSTANLISSFIKVGLHSFYKLIQLRFVFPATIMSTVIRRRQRHNNTIHSYPIQ